MIASAHAHNLVARYGGWFRGNPPRVRSRSRSGARRHVHRARRPLPPGVRSHLGRPARCRLVRRHRRPDPETQAFPRRGTQRRRTDSAHRHRSARERRRTRRRPGSRPYPHPLQALGRRSRSDQRIGRRRPNGRNDHRRRHQPSKGRLHAHRGGARAIACYDVTCASVVVHRRLNRVRAFTEGLTAEEYAPRSRAASEIGEFWNWIRSQGETSCGESQ